MSSAEFAQFTRFAEAVTARDRDVHTGGDGAVAPRVFERVAVLGGAADARVIAALCLAKGAAVTLFSAWGEELDELAQSGGINLRGEGPVGAFQLDQAGTPSITTTARLDAAVDTAELVFLTGPVHRQRACVMLLAGRVRDGQVLVLAPARSFGAIETQWLLRAGDCQAEVTLVECQNPPFWHQRQGAVLHLSACAPAVAATLPHRKTEVIAGLKTFFPHLVEADSVLHSSFADGSGLVEAPALLLSGPAAPGGQPRVPPEAEPLAENHTLRHLLGERHLEVVEALAAERRAVAARFGVRDLPDTESWLTAHAGTPSGSGSRPVPDHAEALGLLRCAVAGSLLPLASAARIAALEAPVTQAMITLATTLAGGDLAGGRRLEAMGVTASSLDETWRALDAIARGESR